MIRCTREKESSMPPFRSPTLAVLVLLTTLGACRDAGLTPSQPPLAAQFARDLPVATDAASPS
jgi:hypothetical protein